MTHTKGDKPMATLEEIVEQLESLSAENLAELEQFVAYLVWKQRVAAEGSAGRLWTFDFVEHFRSAVVSADQDPAGMEVQVGEASSDGDLRMALWQHPPVRGSSHVEYHVPVPGNVRNLRLRFATGLRDGAHLTEGNVVAFRIFCNEWRIWSETQHAVQWREHELNMPNLPGDVARSQFVTDGLGNHRWAWAAWAEPRLVGDLEA